MSTSPKILFKLDTEFAASSLTLISGWALITVGQSFTALICTVTVTVTVTE